jgi:hypothetical protein
MGFGVIAWTNMVVLFFSSLAFLLFYARSVSPDGLEMSYRRRRKEEICWIKNQAG